MNIATADAVNTNTTNIITTIIATTTIAAAMNITNIITTIATMTIAAAMNTKAIATKAAPVMAEKTATILKKILLWSESAQLFLPSASSRF